MAANQNEAPAAGMAGYLLGLGAMPPPRPQDIALAQMHRALNGGVFEHPWTQNAPPPIQVPQQVLPAHPTLTQLAVPAGQHARGRQPYQATPEQGQYGSFNQLLPYTYSC